MKYRIYLFLSLISSGLFIQAQSWEDIKKDNNFLWGEGHGSTVAEADKNALADLISKISTHVSSSFDLIEEETCNGENVDSKTYVSNRVKTYSQATLNNTERLLLKNEPKAHVGRWIAREEIEKIFASRQDKAIDMVESAISAEEKGKIDIALRNYYWALALVRSLQHPNAAVFTTDDGKQHTLITWLKEKIDAVLDGIEIKTQNRKDDDVELSITYNGSPISSIDYTFFDGRDWSNIYSAKDGAGILELAKGNENKNYQIKVEFEYLAESRIDNEIESVLSVLNSVPMRKSYKTVEAKPKQETNTETNENTESSSLTAPASQTNQIKQISKTRNDTLLTTDVTLSDNALQSVIKSIISKRFDVPANLFTKNGYDVYTQLLKYGSAKIIGSTKPQYHIRNRGLIARGIKMSFSFKNSIRKSFVEDVVFYFNNDGKIENITFGLGEQAENDILYKGVWCQESRNSIMEFLENYKTAYALKRLDFINTIFDDDAVIIVANVAYKTVTDKSCDGNTTLKSNQIIKHNRYTKDAYLKNLKRCFDSNEFINIRFANNDVMKLGKGGETYAIQISQDYCSSNYGDKGYLFLMVDINDSDKPLIRLRTWQPEKDPNFGLYGPGDFK